MLAWDGLSFSLGLRTELIAFRITWLSFEKDRFPAFSSRQFSRFGDAELNVCMSWEKG